MRNYHENHKIFKVKVSKYNLYDIEKIMYFSFFKIEK